MELGSYSSGACDLSLGVPGNEKDEGIQSFASLTDNPWVLLIFAFEYPQLNGSHMRLYLYTLCASSRGLTLFLCPQTAVRAEG